MVTFQELLINLASNVIAVNAGGKGSFYHAKLPGRIRHDLIFWWLRDHEEVLIDWYVLLSRAVDLVIRKLKENDFPTGSPLKTYFQSQKDTLPAGNSFNSVKTLQVNRPFHVSKYC